MVDCDVAAAWRPCHREEAYPTNAFFSPELLNWGLMEEVFSWSSEDLWTPWNGTRFFCNDPFPERLSCVCHIPSRITAKKVQNHHAGPEVTSVTKALLVQKEGTRAELRVLWFYHQKTIRVQFTSFFPFSSHCLFFLIEIRKTWTYANICKLPIWGWKGRKGYESACVTPPTFHY